MPMHIIYNAQLQRSRAYNEADSEGRPYSLLRLAEVAGVREVK